MAAIWETAENHPGGPWLFGYFTAADIMFAPVASRFQTYGVSLEGRAGRYLERMLSHPLVQAWFASGQDEPETIDMFELPTSG
ncbi:glutathione S-transferase C-terminal domain-containing protein [Gluconacetobacter dulcium]